MVGKEHKAVELFIRREIEMVKRGHLKAITGIDAALAKPQPVVYEVESTTVKRIGGGTPRTGTAKGHNLQKVIRLAKRRLDGPRGYIAYPETVIRVWSQVGYLELPEKLWRRYSN